MAGSDHKGAAANAVRGVAEGKRLLVGEVGDLAAFLAVASVAVEHHAGDLLFHGVVQALHRGRHNGGALRVASGDDDGVRALAGGQVEETLGFAVGCTGGAFGEGVGAYAGGVRVAYTLAGDVVGAVLLLEAGASGGTDGGALEYMSVEVREGGMFFMLLTMLPISVEPRAKMKVTSRHSPFSSSLTVEPTRPPSCLRSTAGRAAAVEARRATAVVNFMLMFEVGEVDLGKRMEAVDVIERMCEKRVLQQLVLIVEMDRGCQ